MITVLQLKHVVDGSTPSLPTTYLWEVSPAGRGTFTTIIFKLLPLLFYAG